MDQRIRKWFITRDGEGHLNIDEQKLYYMIPINRVPSRPNRFYPVETRNVNGVKYMCTFDDQNQSFVLVAKIHSTEPGFTSLDESDKKNAYELAELYVKKRTPYES